MNIGATPVDRYGVTKDVVWGCAERWSGFGSLLGGLLVVVGGWCVSAGVRERAALGAASAGEVAGAEYVDAMVDATDRLDAAAERALEPNADEPSVRRAAGDALGAFERALAAAKRDAPRGSPRERAVAALAQTWGRYVVALDSVLDQYRPRGERVEALGALAAESPEVRRAVRRLAAVVPPDGDGRVREAVPRVMGVGIVLRVVAVVGVLAGAFVVVRVVRIFRPPPGSLPPGPEA